MERVGALPTHIADYFTADKGDSEAVSQCITENAVVKDEGRTHHGRTAIKHWNADVSTKYQYTSEPIACEDKDGMTDVISRLTGNFPVSPVNLRFLFELEGVKIASLEIMPCASPAASGFSALSPRRSQTGWRCSLRSSSWTC